LNALLAREDVDRYKYDFHMPREWRGKIETQPAVRGNISFWWLSKVTFVGRAARTAIAIIYDAYEVITIKEWATMFLLDKPQKYFTSRSTKQNNQFSS